MTELMWSISFDEPYVIDRMYTDAELESALREGILPPGSICAHFRHGTWVVEGQQGQPQTKRRCALEEKA